MQSVCLRSRTVLHAGSCLDLTKWFPETKKNVTGRLAKWRHQKAPYVSSCKKWPVKTLTSDRKPENECNQCLNKIHNYTCDVPFRLHIGTCIRHYNGNVLIFLATILQKNWWHKHVIQQLPVSSYYTRACKKLCAWQRILQMQTTQRAYLEFLL